MSPCQDKRGTHAESRRYISRRRDLQLPGGVSPTRPPLPAFQRSLDRPRLLVIDHWPRGLAKEQSMKSKVRGPALGSAVVALGIGAFSSGASAEDIGKTTSSQLAPSRLAYARLYCTPDHESHFAELTADLAEQNFAPPAAPIYIGGSQPASSVFFAGFEAHWGAADLVKRFSCLRWPRACSRSQRQMAS